jgi:hypothetical protein
MTIIGSNVLAGASGQAAGGYAIERSLRFNSSDSAYCSRVPSTAGNRKTWTWAGWVKRSALVNAAVSLFGAGADSANISVVQFLNNNIIYYDYTNNVFTTRIDSSAVFRDVSAYYHFLVAVDTTQATAANRVRLYVNGSQITAFSTATYPAQNFDTQINTNTVHVIGRESNFYAINGNYYLADIHFIDGQALDPTSFGEFSATTGVWVPKAYTGSYGTNGAQLKFEDNSSNTATTLGKDTSPNGNNWTPNNLSVTAGAGNDSLVDVPTNGAQTDTGAGGEVRGNYCTWNPLAKGTSTSTTNGNLQSATTTDNTILGTIGVSSGKWYWECDSGNQRMVGLARNNTNLNTYCGGDANSWGYYNVNGTKYNNNSSSAYGASYSTTDVIGIAFDADNGTLTFYKNGVSQGTAFTGLTSGPYFSAAGNGSVGTTVMNFGQRPFAYTAPSGFKALNTANLSAPLVTKGSSAMDVLTWSGNNASPRSFTGLNFSPDFIWAKCRNASAGHSLYDSVRGTGKELQSQDTQAELTNSIYGYINSFDSNGFTVVSGTEPTFGAGSFNLSGRTYVGWCWDAGSSTVTNTQGSITSQVRANASAGFSVVTWTNPSTANQTIGHGLGVKPAMIIRKYRNNADAWLVYHTSLGQSNILTLNTTNASNTDAGVWPGTIDSTVFSTGALGYFPDGWTAVAYCWAPVTGYSSFGSYTGNGSSDGPFVYTGFRPRWVMIKRSSSGASGGNWIIKDTSRPGYNTTNLNLFSNSSTSETTEYPFDILSNGFKIRETNIDINASGSTYVWAAFAESPFQYARAR